MQGLKKYIREISVISVISESDKIRFGSRNFLTVN